MKIDAETLKKQVILHLPYILFLLVFAKLFAHAAYVFFKITISRYQDIAQPKRMSLLFQPGSGAQGLFVAASGQGTVAFGIEFFNIEQYQVRQT